MEIHLEVLSAKTKQVFSLLSKFSWIQQFYLAGGTAMALQLGHRISKDLDFFAPQIFDESQLIQRLSGLGRFQLEKKSDQTIIGFLNDTKLSFLAYQYPLLSPFKIVAGLKTADVIDIACMKIDAIASRGSKRDFIDLYFVAKEILPLPEILGFFEKKYSSISYNMMHVKKSLVFFKDAEGDPMPKMLKPVDWSAVVLFFKDQCS